MKSKFLQISLAVTLAFSLLCLITPVSSAQSSLTSQQSGFETLKPVTKGQQEIFHNSDIGVGSQKLERDGLMFVQTSPSMILGPESSLRSDQMSEGVLGIQSITEAKPEIQVKAHVGEFQLNINGLASPFASIILTSNGVFYRSTTADKDGRWEINDISINKGFSKFCLQHIDFRNLGSSTTCFNVSPAKDDITKRDIFLPPTIALQRSTITEGGSAIVFGYSLPFSKVTIHIKGGQTYETTADEHGYYEIEIKDIPAGTFELYATAVFNGKPSETPENSVVLRALTWWQMLLMWLKSGIRWLWDIITRLGLGPLWLILPLIPLLIYLIVKIWPERFTFIYDSEIYVLFHPKKKLHHAWFVGY